MLEIYHVYHNNHGDVYELVLLAIKKFEGQNVKRVALRQIARGIPMAVVKVSPVVLFLT